MGPVLVSLALALVAIVLIGLRLSRGHLHTLRPFLSSTSGIHERMGRNRRRSRRGKPSDRLSSNQVVNVADSRAVLLGSGWSGQLPIGKVEHFQR